MLSYAYRPRPGFSTYCGSTPMAVASRSSGALFARLANLIRACQMVCVSHTERNGTIMTMTNEKQQHDDGPSGQDLVEQLKASGQLDALFEQIDAGQVERTGDGGFAHALVKAALERGLQAELTSHLGYEQGSGEASKHAKGASTGLCKRGVHR